MVAHVKDKAQKRGGAAASVVLFAGAMAALIWWFGRGQLSAASGTATLQGTVNEEGTAQGGLSSAEIFGPGLPVEGAVVTIGGLSSQPTGSDGNYSVAGLAPGITYTGEVTAPGYQSEPLLVTLGPGDNPMDVTLTVQYDLANEVY